MQKKLTKKLLDTLKSPPNGRTLIYDTDLAGLAVRITATGSKTFFLQYRMPGAGRRGSAGRVTLGSFGKLTVDQARTLAKKHLAEIANGRDPARERAVAKSAPTVAELGESYLDDVLARRKPSTAAEYRRMWSKHVVQALGRIRVRVVTQADVARLHRSMQKTPYLANRVLALVGAFFTYAADEGCRAKRDNPAHEVKPYAEQQRERFLAATEFARLGEAIARAEREGLPPAPQHRKKPKGSATRSAKETAKHRPKSVPMAPSNPYAVAALRLLALTGCRELEIRSLRWDAVDLERGFLRLADTKTGKSVHPLGAAAIELLTTLTRAPGSPYVLPGAKTGTHLEGIKRLWFAVRYAAGLDDVRLHDLRHSFASTVAVGGDSLTVIRSLLGHSDISTTQRYAHLGDDPVKSSADRASEAIAGWLAGRDTPVEPMRGRKKAGQGPRRMLVAANHARVRADDTTAMNTTPR